MMKRCVSSRDGIVLLLVICCIIIYINRNVKYLDIDYHERFTEKDRRLIIYDFDKTMSVKPLYGILKNEYSAINEVGQLTMLHKFEGYCANNILFVDDWNNMLLA